MKHNSSQTYILLALYEAFVGGDNVVVAGHGHHFVRQKVTPKQILCIRELGIIPMIMTYRQYFQGTETIDSGGDEDQNGTGTIDSSPFYLVICPRYVFSLQVAHSSCRGDKEGRSSNSGGGSKE